MSSRIFAIDPGTKGSGWVAYDAVERRIMSHGNDLNGDLLRSIRNGATMGMVPVVEMMRSHGCEVGFETFVSMLWAGRFLEAAGISVDEVEAHYIFRDDVRIELCHTARSGDPQVRGALIEMFGPGKDVAIGRKLTPGPLYGISNHAWQALGVAVTYHRLRRRAETGDDIPF